MAGDKSVTGMTLCHKCTASHPFIFLFILLSNYLNHSRRIWRFWGSCKKYLEPRDRMNLNVGYGDSSRLIV